MSTKPTPENAAGKSSLPSWLHAYAIETSRLHRWILLFLLLSIADLVFTYFLLNLSPDFYESNPIANWFFKHWNIAGMTFFKFGVVAFVIVIAEVVERHRPFRGKFVLIVGCLATAAVVLYSYWLYKSYVPHGNGPNHQQQHIIPGPSNGPAFR